MSDNMYIDGNISKAALWTGRTLSTLVVLFLVFDAVIHIMKIAPVVTSFEQLGLPLSIAVPIGIIELICIALYIYPKTSILGAILQTGYLGGAVLTNYRAGTPLFSNVLFPVYVGIFLWAGLYLRDLKLRALIPFKR